MKKSIIIILTILIIVCTALGIVGFLQSKKGAVVDNTPKEYKIEYKYYLDGVEVSEMPKNEIIENDEDGTSSNEDNVPTEVETKYSFQEYNCTNNVKGLWNNETWKFTIPEKTSDSTCVLYFVSNYLDVDVTATNGTVNELDALKDRKVKRGESISYSITPTKGYKFEKVECTNDTPAEWNEENSTLTVSNVTKNTTCEITFSIGEYTINFTANNGIITEESKVVKYGESITTTIKPGSDYIYNEVLCTNNQKATYNVETQELTISNVTDNATCTVDFTPNTYTVTLKIVNGTPVEDSKTVRPGGKVSFTFTNNEGYTTANADITCTNGLIGEISGSLFSVDNVTSNGTCTLTFKAIETSE